MNIALSKMVAIYLVAAAIHGSRPLTAMEQEADAQRPTTQQSSPDTMPQAEMKFKLLMMSNGFTKNGFTFGATTYETVTHIKVYVPIIHTRSREGAKKEYDDQLKGAARIIEQGQVQDKPASKPATT
jgi:hypothetical protein